jgi:hypothetical protein
MASRSTPASGNPTTRRPGGPVLATVFCALLLGGCAPLDVGAHASFDSWFVGSADSVHLEEWGILALDGGPGGYLVNDVLIRTPALIVQDTACLLLVPVALPYYWIGSLTGGGDSSASTAAAAAEPAPAPGP